MSVDFTIKQHDQLPELVVTLTDAAQSIVNIAGATVRFIMSIKGGANIIDAPATIVNASTGQVKYTWVEGDTDNVGTYNGEFEVLFGDGRAETFPNTKYIVIKVFADLGGVGL